MSHKKQSIKLVQEQARKQVRDLNGFDYNAPAELFPTPSKTNGLTRLPRRFASPSRKYQRPPWWAPILRSMRRVSEHKKFAICMKMLPIR